MKYFNGGFHIQHLHLYSRFLSRIGSKVKNSLIAKILVYGLAAGLILSYINCGNQNSTGSTVTQHCTDPNYPLYCPSSGRCCGSGLPYHCNATHTCWSNNNTSCSSGYDTCSPEGGGGGGGGGGGVCGGVIGSTCSSNSDCNCFASKYCGSPSGKSLPAYCGPSNLCYCCYGACSAPAGGGVSSCNCVSCSDPLCTGSSVSCTQSICIDLPGEPPNWTP